MTSNFLEAHYYAGGLRHRDFSLGGPRPTWAPPADAVGFSDEFALSPDTAAVEIRRLLHDRRRLTWLGVYHRSTDARLGDRSNHAGIGIWLNEFSVADARSLLHGLDVLAKKLAGSADPEVIATPALEFLADFVPKYLLPLGALPNLPGLVFASGRLSSTRLTYVQTNQSLGECRLVGDEVLNALYVGSGPKHASRELICVSPNPLPPRDRDRFHSITDAEDAASKIIFALPSALVEVTTKLEAASADLERATRELDAANARSSEYDALQDRVREFQQDPLNVVLGAVREVSSKLDNLSIRTELPHPTGPSSYRHRPQHIVSRPNRQIVEENPEAQQLDWFVITVLGLGLLFLFTILYLIIDRFASQLLWP